jgi:D-alanine-D-alanine ligase
MSARAVSAALDQDKYELVLIGIDAEGRWSLDAASGGAIAESAGPAGLRLALTPDGADRELILKGSDASLRGVDLIFPVLHGPCGEDGSIQGLARLADLPCVGADILGSALCMDKDAAKRMLREAGMAVAPFVAFSSMARARSAWPEVQAALGRDLFVKPANLGSSVGVSRARSGEEYEAALELAFHYDVKVLVEKRMEGREIEVAVLGHRESRASLPGEVVPRDGYYSYEAKYLDEDGARIIAPAELKAGEGEACMRAALDACRALCVRGMARVDMFLGWSGRPVVNEVNTIPGFTARSMFPLLWEASGMGLPRLVDELIESALEAHAERAALWSAPPS